MKTDVAFCRWDRKERMWLFVKGVVAYTSASGWETDEYRSAWIGAYRFEIIDKHPRKDGPPPFLVVVLKKHPLTNAMMRPRWYTPNPGLVMVLEREEEE